MSNKKIKQQVNKQTKRQPDPKGVYSTPPYVQAAQDAAKKENQRNKKKPA
jgi:hypothetical protein